MFDISTEITSGESSAYMSSQAEGIAAALKAGRKYGRYIILNCDDGRRAVKATVTDMNFDPRSLVFVTRSASIESGMFTLTSVSLGADETTEDVKLTLSEPIKKNAGTPLTVSVTVRLSAVRDCAAFVGSNNPLCRFLLGEGELGRAQIAIGRNRSALGTAQPASNDTYRLHEASVKFMDESVEFTAVGSGTPFEAYLLLDGVACVRALPLAANSKVLTGSGKCNTFGSFSILTETTDVMAVTCDGIPVTDYDTEWARETVGGAVSTGIKMKSAPTLVADGDFVRLAALSGEEALVFGVADRRPQVEAIRRIYGRESDVRIARDGALLCYDEGKAVLITPDGDEFSHTLEPFDDWQMICPYSGKYTLAVKRSDTVSVYGLTADALTLKQTVSAGERCAIGCVDGRRIVVCGLNIGGQVIGEDGEEIEECIGIVFDDFDATDLVISGHIVAFNADGETYLVDMTLIDGYPIEEGEWALSGEICTQGTSMFVANPAGSITTIGNAACDPTVTSHCRLKEFAVRAHADGSIDYLPFGGFGVTLKSPSFKVGSRVGYTYRAPTVADKGNGVKTTISITM